MLKFDSSLVQTTMPLCTKKEGINPSLLFFIIRNLVGVELRIEKVVKILVTECNHY